MKNKHSIILILGLSLFLLTSFVEKPHLLEGDWETKDNNKITLPVGEDMIIDQWYFNDFMSQISMTKNNKEYTYGMAFKIYESMEGFDKPVILLKSTCDKDFMMVLTIQELSKSTLVIKFEENEYSKGIKMQPAQIKFKRIAGPPENME